MEFLLEPLELGSELDELVNLSQIKITCNQGYVCDQGTAEPQPKSP